jgi:hypothetical protein
VIITVSRPSGSAAIARPLEKLLARARLPGAFTFDLAAAALRRSADHLADEERLVLALPASWLVNSPAVSRTFRAWLAPALRDAWIQLLQSLEGGPEAWLAMAPPERAAVEALVARLSSEHGGLEGVTKVLALLVPQSVPLMPPAAVAFVVGDGVSGPAAFAPLMDWFSREALKNERALIDVARGYSAAPLDAPQVLDRLLWFESDGHVHFPELSQGDRT